MECLNYHLYSLCSHILAVAQNAGNLGMIVEHAHKKARPVKLTSLFNLVDYPEVIQITEYKLQNS